MDLVESNLTVILPTLNEEGAIGQVIDEIRSLPGFSCDILVVDSSSDNTYNIASSRGVHLISVPPNGKGYAIKKALEVVKTPYVIMMDADYTYPAQYIKIIFGRLSGGYGAVIGYRKWKDKDSISLINLVGNKLLSLLASILYRRKVYDVCSGMWGFRKDILDRFILKSNGFTLEAELFINTIKSDCKFIQIPISYRARLSGSKAKLKVWDGFKISWFLIRRKT